MAISCTQVHFPPNSAIILYLKKLFKVFNVTFHLVLEVRKCSNFHHFFIWVSARFTSPWIFTSNHHADLGTIKAMGSLHWSLQGLSCNWEWSSSWGRNWLKGLNISWTAVKTLWPASGYSKHTLFSQSCSTSIVYNNSLISSLTYQYLPFKFFFTLIHLNW